MDNAVYMFAYAVLCGGSLLLCLMGIGYLYSRMPENKK